MENRLRLIAPRLVNHPLIAVAVLAITVIAVVMLPFGASRAQTHPVTGPLNPAHLNPAIEKLAAGKPIFSIQTSDLSMENAREMGSLDTDLVYVDMQHAPLSVGELARFALMMNNKAYTLKKGTAQPKSALIAKFPPDGGEHVAWVVNQALDMGLMGFEFPGVDTKEDAEFAVKSMRYAAYRAYPHTQEGPPGMRGWNPVRALWVWGISADEYRRRADVWPLNPDGDLLCVINIESTEGLKNVDEIASVPGVSVLHAAAGGDLSTSMGVPNDSPEVEAGRQKILKACLTHNIVCAIHTAKGKAAIDQRLKEGWRYILSYSGTANE
jgi:4-hydroxy-2-oxoheptanedioate aldolase